MCLAIAPNRNTGNGIFSRLWRIIASSPLRLFSFYALLHSLVLASLLIFDISNGARIDTHAYMFAFSYGIVAALAFGYLLTWLPRKYSLSPVHYGRYSSIYLMMMTGLVIIETGLAINSEWILAGMLMLIPGWLIALQSLWQLHIWINSEAQRLSRALMILLAFIFVSMGLSALGQVFDLSMLVTLATSSSTLLAWPLFIVATLTLLLIAPAKGRVISQ